MKEDPRETRKIAANWREYLAEMKETFRVIAWVWREFATPESRKWMMKGVIYLLLSVILLMAQPWLVRLLIDAILARDVRTLVLAVIGETALMMAHRVLFWRFDRAREIADGYIMGRIDNRSSELFFGKSLGQHIRDDGMLTTANIEKGRGRAFECQKIIFFDGLPLVVEFGLAFVFLSLLSPVAGAVMFALIIVYAGFMFRVNMRVMQECTPIDADFRKFNRHRSERWESIERVKTSGKEDEEVRHMTSFFADIIGRDRKFWFWYIGLATIRGFFNIIVSSALLAYGAWLVWRGDWTVGLIFPFFQWIRKIGDNLWRFSEIERRLNWNMPSVRSMMEALSTPSDVVEKDGALALRPDRAPSVEFVGVSYAYGRRGEDTGKHPHVLKGFDLKIEPGEKVALIGPSGAGKTTVMRLLLRYADPERGCIRVGGLDLRDVRLADWRKLVGYIPQQPQILDGTVRYNLLYGAAEEERGKVTDGELWEMMRRLKIDFGERLTDGLETVVGRRGIKLSGGEAQRLMIGAAVMKKPRFLIIDEATSSLDSTTEKEVQVGLAAALSPDISALIIAHRLSTVRHLCTKFVLLRQGQDVPDGEDQVEAIADSFEDLYEKSPTFRRLADDQGIVIRPKPPGAEALAAAVRSLS